MHLDALASRVRSLQTDSPGGRALIGIAGEPGGGKSTLAAQLADRFEDAVVAPMDGFHLANGELERLGRADRKGALDTFDAAGYRALLARLRSDELETVYAPAYTREYEEAIAGSVPVTPADRIIVSEGNYLLVPNAPWPSVRRLFDEVWYLDTPQDLRLEWLIARHIAAGKTPDTARAWALGPDEANARLVRSSRSRADLVVSAADLWPVI